MASDKKTMTLNLTESEMQALEELCSKKEMSKTAIIKQALRLYQVVELRRERGERMLFEDDKTKEKLEMMLI